MTWFVPFLNFGHWLATAMLFGLALYSVQRRITPVVKTLTVFFFLGGFWSLLAGLIVAAPDLETKILLNRIKMLSPSLIPMALVALASALNGNLKFPKWLWGMIGIAPTVSILLLLSPYHELLISDYGIWELQNFQILTFKNGPWFGVHILYARISLLLSLFYLLQSLRHLHPTHRGKIWLVFISILTPSIADVIAVFYVPELRYIQIVPSLLALSGGLLTYAIFGQRVLDIIPFARNLILDQVPDPHFVLDPNDILVDFNRAASETFGVSKDTLGKPAHEVFKIYPAIRNGVTTLAQAQGESLEITLRLRDKDKTLLVFRRPIFNDANENIGHLIVTRDISAQRKIETALRDLNQMKAKLFGVLAHDLKSQAQNVSFLSDVLMTEKNVADPDRLKSIADHLHQSSSNTTEFIEGVLRWAKTQSYTVGVRRETLAIHTLLTPVLGYLEQTASQKRIQFETVCDPSYQVAADPDMIQTVLRNLLTNAIKVSPPNSNIRVAVSENANEFVFSIQDNGNGISSPDLAKLFSFEFSSAQPNPYYKSEIGWGLVLCDEFVRLHGGRIWAESEITKGSIFCFALPKRDVPSVANA